MTVSIDSGAALARRRVSKFHSYIYVFQVQNVFGNMTYAYHILYNNANINLLLSNILGHIMPY